MVKEGHTKPFLSPDSNLSAESWQPRPPAPWPGPVPFKEGSAAKCPGLTVNKHFLLLRRCPKVPCLGLERKQTAGYLALTSRGCGKAGVAASEHGDYEPNARLGKRTQARGVGEAALRPDPGPGGGENRAAFRFRGDTSLVAAVSPGSRCHLRHQNRPCDGPQLAYFLTKLSEDLLTFPLGTSRRLRKNNPLQMLIIKGFLSSWRN